jgi:hypothetical protein
VGPSVEAPRGKSRYRTTRDEHCRLGHRAFPNNGLVLAADHLYNHAYLSVGHKGLFFERLDRGVADAAAPGASPGPLASDGSPVDTPRLVPFARGVYHNRNRTLIPGGGSPQLVGLAGVVPTGPPGNAWNSVALSQPGLSSGAAVAGRFMQADPNATGMVIATVAGYHGAATLVSGDSFDLRARFTDGSSLFQYLGSSSLAREYAMGLFFMPGPSDFITGVFQSLVEDYSMRLDFDVEWANDWSTPDDWHSRLDNKWVTLAVGRGLYNAFDISIPGTGIEFNPLDAFANASGGKGGTSATPRVLPPSTIVNSNGVRIVHFYHSNDHRPAHVHVYSDGNKPTRVGPLGHPLDANDRPLTSKESAVFKSHRFEINKTIKNIQRWMRGQPGDAPKRSGPGKRR